MFLTETTGGWIVCLALVRLVSASASPPSPFCSGTMLCFAGSGSRYLVGHSRPSALGVNLRRQHFGSSTSVEPARRRQSQQRGHENLLPWEATASRQHRMVIGVSNTAVARQQRQQQVHRTNRWASSSPCRTIRGRHAHPAMTAKSGVHTASDAKNPTDTTQPPTAGKVPSPSPTAPAHQEDVAAGTRVRLRDTGRLGTVVGKKAGGWWIVDLAESWGGAVAGDVVGGIPSVRNNRTVSTVSSSSSSRSISTRRLNMEPLGAAYAEPSSQEQQEPLIEISTVGGERVFDFSNSTSNGKRPTGGRGGSSGRGRSGTGESQSFRAGGAGATELPSVLRGRTISLNTMMASTMTRTTTGADADPVAIHTMSAEGLAHADMKEWLIFSDLHVSPGSLAVSLEVSFSVAARCLRRRKDKNTYVLRDFHVLIGGALLEVGTTIAEVLPYFRLFLTASRQMQQLFLISFGCFSKVRRSPKRRPERSNAYPTIQKSDCESKN